MKHLLVGNGINIQFNPTDYTTQQIVLRILKNCDREDFPSHIIVNFPYLLKNYLGQLFLEARDIIIQNLKGWITELGEKRKELLAQKAAEEATLLPNLLMKYMEIRKEERKDWTRAGQNRGTSQDLKAVSEALSYLRQKGISTVEDLEVFLESSGKSAADYRSQMKPKEARSKVIDGILASRTDCKECKPVYEKYQKIFFKKTKEKFKQEHPEVARYAKATAYLAKHPDDKDSTQKKLDRKSVV